MLCYQVRISLKLTAAAIRVAVLIVATAALAIVKVVNILRIGRRGDFLFMYDMNSTSISSGNNRSGCNIFHNNSSNVSNNACSFDMVVLVVMVGIATTGQSESK